MLPGRSRGRGDLPPHAGGVAPRYRRCRRGRRLRGLGGPPVPASPATGGGGPGREAEPFGVYLHIPFCTRRCDYCAFATWTDRGHLVEPYMLALRSDVERAV